jgi:hypothetical protein
MWNYYITMIRLFLRKKKNSPQPKPMVRKCVICSEPGTQNGSCVLPRPACCQCIYVCVGHPRVAILETFRKEGACNDHQFAKVAEVEFLTPLKKPKKPKWTRLADCCQNRDQSDTASIGRRTFVNDVCHHCYAQLPCASVSDDPCYCSEACAAVNQC